MNSEQGENTLRDVGAAVVREERIKCLLRFETHIHIYDCNQAKISLKLELELLRYEFGMDQSFIGIKVRILI